MFQSSGAIKNKLNSAEKIMPNAPVAFVKLSPSAFPET